MPFLTLFNNANIKTFPQINEFMRELLAAYEGTIANIEECILLKEMCLKKEYKNRLILDPAGVMALVEIETLKMKKDKTSREKEIVLETYQQMANEVSSVEDFTPFFEHLKSVACCP